MKPARPTAATTEAVSMSKHRRIGTIAVITLLTGALAACGGSNDDTNSASASETSADTITLSVPPTSDTTDVELVVNPGNLATGTEISLYAYKSGNDAAAPSCQNVAEPVGATQVTPTDSRVVLRATVAQPGQYWWVLVAPGYTSECGAAGSSTTVRASPVLQLKQEDPQYGLTDIDKAVKAGKPFRFNVATDEPAPAGHQWHIDVTWYGPFETTPEAASAGCDSDAPIAAEATVKAGKPGNYRTQVTPPNSGVYRVVAELPESEYTTESTTGCDDNSPFIRVK